MEQDCSYLTMRGNKLDIALMLTAINELNMVSLCEELPILSSTPLATHTTLAYSKLPQIILLTIYQLSTDHLWSISSWISTFPGGWMGVGWW